MIGIVRIALSRPYTFIVLALLILIVGPLSALRTPTDIFPDIKIPVIAVVWQYTGLPPDAGPKYPAELSGGMKTRAGRARGCAPWRCSRCLSRSPIRPSCGRNASR